MAPNPNALSLMDGLAPGTNPVGGPVATNARLPRTVGAPLRPLGASAKQILARPVRPKRAGFKRTAVRPRAL